MAVLYKDRFTLAFQRYSKVAAGITMLVGVLVLFGWLLNIAALKSVLPGSIFIKANTALAFVAAGLALWFLQAKSTDGRPLILRRCCAILVLLAGLLTLSEYVFGWDFGIDQLLFKDPLSPGDVFPGRIPPVSALNLLLLGIALLLLDLFRRYRASQIFTLGATLFALLAVIGYLYGVESLYRLASFTAIALPTAITFLILCLGLLFVHPDQGWMAILTNNGAAGILARRLLPTAVVVPILLGWLRLLGQAAGLYGTSFGVGLFAISNIIVFTVLIAWSAMSLYRVDLARQQAEDKTRLLNVDLEARVVERTSQLTLANQQLEHAVSDRQQEHDLMQALMDNIPDTIYFKDMASRFTRINKAQARLLGVTDVQQALGKTDADFQALQLAADFDKEEQRLFETRQPIIDRREFNPTRDGQPRWLSTTKVPMLDQHGKVTGLIGISRDITERIRAEEALSQANIRLTERISQMSLLNELDEQLHACAAVEEVYQVTTRLVNQLFPAELGALYAINNSRNLVETAAVWGRPPPQAQTFGLDDCWALRQGQLHVSGGSRANISCRHLADQASAFSICIPLLAQGETLGILHLRPAPATDLSNFDDAQQQLARLVSDSVALACANVKLRETLRQQSIRDPLTELFNRRYMEESLDRELRRAARNQTTVGIIMLDVDHFKLINDAYGHDAGDAVFRQVGRFLMEHTRGGDIACRYGGDEFALILPEASLEQTCLRAEQHRLLFKTLPMEHNGRLLDSPTLSFGVSAFPEHGTTGADILRAADAALYRAKQAGRDRVAVAE